MDFKYHYKEGETPEERLRNKLQSVFFLVEILEKNKEQFGGIRELIDSAVSAKADIGKILDDIPVYYKIKIKPFRQNSTYKP